MFFKKFIHFEHELALKPNVCIFNFSELGTTKRLNVSCYDYRDCPDYNRGFSKQLWMLIELVRIKGVLNVSFGSCSLSIKKLSVYSWREILPEAEKIIIKYLANRSKAKKQKKSA